MRTLPFQRASTTKEIEELDDVIHLGYPTKFAPFVAF